MKRFINWLTDRFTAERPTADQTLRVTGAHAKPKPSARMPQMPQDSDYSSETDGEIVDGGPGKNVSMRSKYIREDTGTHETLKIVDISLLDADDENGIDPYNTGRFDRAKSWNASRSRK